MCDFLLLFIRTRRNASAAAEQTETDLTDFVQVLPVGELGLQMARVGTTAELVQMAEDSDEESGVLTVRAKAIGRQRFWLRETRQQIDGCARCLCFEHLLYFSSHFSSSTLLLFVSSSPLLFLSSARLPLCLPLPRLQFLVFHSQYLRNRM